MPDWDEAVAALVRLRGDRQLRTAYLLCGDVEQAHDLVQDALTRTFASQRRRLPQLSNKTGQDSLELAEVEAYVRRALTSQFLDDRRRVTRWRSVEHLLVRPESTSPATTELRLDVIAALRQLAPRPRTCLVLRYYADLTVSQIATELSLAEGSVKRYLHEGVAALGLALVPASSEEA